MKKKITAIILVLILCFSTLAFAADTHRTIEVDANLMTVLVNGKKVEADNFVYNGTTYLPLRAVSEALGNDVDYDPNTQSAIINKNENIASKRLIAADVYHDIELISDILHSCIYSYLSIENIVLGPNNSVNYINQSIASYAKDIDELYTPYIDAVQIVQSWRKKDALLQEILTPAISTLVSYYKSYEAMTNYINTLYVLAQTPSQTNLNKAHSYLEQAIDYYQKCKSDVIQNYNENMNRALNLLDADTLNPEDLVSISSSTSTTLETEPEPTQIPDPEPEPEPTPNLELYNKQYEQLTTQYNAEMDKLNEKEASYRAMREQAIEDIKNLNSGYVSDTTIARINTQYFPLINSVIEEKTALTNQYESNVEQLKQSFGIA